MMLIMDLLKPHLFISFFIATMYFILKTLINRFYKEDKEYYQFVKKSVFKDSLLILVISYLTFILKDQIMNTISASTQVFTNEPTF